MLCRPREHSKVNRLLMQVSTQIKTANDCHIRLVIDPDSGEEHTDGIQCGCGHWNPFHYDQYGEWTCDDCGQLHNCFGQTLARSAWSAPEYGDFY